MTTQAHTQYIVGVDGGGTKCRAVLFDQDGDALATGVAGSANISRDIDISKLSIVDAVTKAVAASGLDIALDQLVVSAGLAGANVANAREALSAWDHPFARFDFVSDLHTALLGAHGGETGALLIVGTGSCAAALKDDHITQFGGHGFLLGDKGSGAWIGRQAVAKALEQLDGLHADTEFMQTVCAFFNAKDSSELVDQLAVASSAIFAKLAPTIVKRSQSQCATSKVIVDDALEYLNHITTKALSISGGKLVVMGGLGQMIAPLLRSDIQASLTKASYSAEKGAFLYLKSHPDKR